MENIKEKDIFTTIISLVFIGCSTPMTYVEREKKCFQIMKEAGVKRCHSADDYKAYSPFEFGWELGRSNGFLNGCLESLENDNRSN